MLQREIPGRRWRILPDLYQTQRLRVRHLTTEDVDAMVQVYGDREAMKWVDDGEPMEAEECLMWVHVSQRNYKKYGYGMSAIEDRNSNNIVGFIGVVHPNGQAEPEIKYALKRDCWGRGIATEAAIGMLEYMWTEFAASTVIATIDPDNHASRRVLEKAGMQIDRQETDADGMLFEYLSWHRAG